ncbi:MAG: amidohydrolase family protein [Chloroflexota bacterium]
MLRAMDAVGIDIACLFNIFHPNGTTGNDQTARFIAQHPDRFRGFAYVSPLLLERMVSELTRAIDELNFVAIKLYPPYTSWDLDEPIWHPIYEFANERGLAVLFHTGAVMRSGCLSFRLEVRHFLRHFENHQVGCIILLRTNLDWVMISIQGLTQIPPLPIGNPFLDRIKAAGLTYHIGTYPKSFALSSLRLDPLLRQCMDSPPLFGCSRRIRSNQTRNHSMPTTSVEALRDDLPMTNEVVYFQTGTYGPTSNSVLDTVSEILVSSL